MVVGRGSAINRPPLTGFLTLGARWRWYESTKARRCASISSSEPSPPKIWVMTRASARCKEALRALQPFQRFGSECPDASHARQANMQLPRSNPSGVVQQSPGLARRQPWVIARQCPSTPTGLRPGGRKTARLRPPPATTPLGLGAAPSPPPRVVPSVQPWALLHNRVAVEATRAGLGLKSRKLSSRASHRHSIPIWSPGNLSLTRMRRVGIETAGTAGRIHAPR